MTTEDTIQYENALKNCMKSHFSKFKLANSGIPLLSKLLNNINTRLLNEFRDGYQSAEENEKFSLRSARDSVEKVLEGNLRRAALSEAHRQLALFEMGLLEYGDNLVRQYHPVREKALKAPGQKKGDKQKDEIGKETTRPFKSGIFKLHSTSHFPLCLEPSASEFLAFSLCKFTQMVAAKASESPVDDLQHSDIRRALNEFFGQEVLRSAHSEGSKCLVLYENDLLDCKTHKTASKIYKDQQNAIRAEEMKFKSGVRDFFTGVSHGGKMDEKACHFLEYLLISIAHHLASQATEICERGSISEMTDEQLNDAVRNTLTNDLKQHALIQGSSAVSNCRNSIPEEEDVTTLTKSKSAVKRKKKPRHSPKKKSPKKSKKSSPRKKSLQKRTPQKRSPQKRSPQKKTPQKRSPQKKTPQKRSPTKRKRSPKKSQIKLQRESERSPKRKKTETRKSSEKGEPKFSSLIVSYAPAAFPSLKVNLPRETAEHIGGLLEQVCEKLAAESAEIAAGEAEMGVETVREAVNRVFSAELAQHAVSFGSNVVMLESEESGSEIVLNSSPSNSGT